MSEAENADGSTVEQKAAPFSESEKIAELQRELATIKKTDKKKSSRFKRLKASQMRAYHARKRQLEMESEQHSEEINRLKMQIEQMSSLKTQIEELSAKNVHANTTVASLQEKLKQLEAEQVKKEEEQQSAKVGPVPKKQDHGYGDLFQPINEESFSFYSLY